MIGSEWNRYPTKKWRIVYERMDLDSLAQFRWERARVRAGRPPVAPIRVSTSIRFQRERKRNGETDAQKNHSASFLLDALGSSLVSARAQQPKKVPRIGYLSSADAARESTRAEGIRLALRERGYIEGQNIAIEYRYAEGKLDRFPELAAELVRLKVDIIVVAGGDPSDPGGQECDQDDSHRYGGQLGSILSRQA